MTKFVNLKSKTRALHLSGDAWLQWDGFEKEREWQGLTIEVWVKLKEPQLLHGLITADFSLSLGMDGVSFHPGGEQHPVHVPHSIEKDKWTHLAVVLYENKQLRVYVNGQLSSERQVTEEHQIHPKPLIVGLLPYNHAGHFRSRAAEEVTTVLDGEDTGGKGDPEDALAAMEGTSQKCEHATLNGYIGALNIWSLARKKHEIMVDMFVEPPSWANGLVLCQWMEKDEDIKSYQHHGHATLETISPPVMHDMELAEFNIPDPTEVKGRLCDMSESFEEWDENSIYQRFKDQIHDIPLICTRYIADINPDDDGSNENVEEDGLVLSLNPNSNLIMMSRSESDEWRASFEDFDSNIIYGKGATTDEENSEAELFNLHLCDENRAYFAYSGEYGSLSYALLVKMTHAETGEVRWVIWDPTIEVGTRPTTGGT